MEKELPQLDIDEDFLVGTGITKEILNMYKDYPCYLKAKVFVLCMSDNIKATIDAKQYTVNKNSFITLSPGSIIQIHETDESPKLYFMLFSSKFINQIKVLKLMTDYFYMFKSNPVLLLSDKSAKIYEKFFNLLIETTESIPKFNPKISQYILLAILTHIKDAYLATQSMNLINTTTRNKQICQLFLQLALQNYVHERNISFYAEKIGITPTHLSNTVKQSTHKTVMDIIAELVINNAKAQLKSTNLSINEIARSLNFANVSFFGKYFKRYTGMSPQTYRNC